MTGTTTIDTLRALDPEPAAPTDDVRRRRRDAMIERVVAAPQQAPAGSPRARRARRRAVLVVAGVAVLAAPAAVLGGHAALRQLDPTAHGLDGADLAAWVSTSTPRSATQLSADAKQWCIDATDRQAGKDAPVSISGGDQRGAVASMVIHRGPWTDMCVTSSTGGGGMWELASGPQEPIAAIGDRAVRLQSSGTSGGDVRIGSAWGQAGRDVRSLVLRAGSRNVNAVVVDGLWITWWPGGEDSDDVARTATVTYTDGSTAVVALPSA
ncbi:hypothetical protein [Amnibacterium setariae]|uniref:Uncharacterized protein n=1 Tax=Amnibacterium setariae TaxID=2306585 RepID=A0A3A1U6N1_9MICO|nr:hypothetical protein [Amnibacterium setariae]RIX28584.1 hypothetical protein D1781_14325 [Amnibacterium setariae]